MTETRTRSCGRRRIHTFGSASLAALIVAVAAPSHGQAIVDLRDTTILNPAANIPAQCYTKTELDDGVVVNPCYTCHVRGQEPNYTNDSDLQLENAFPSAALENPWDNLFEDRSARVAATPDAEILDYIRQDNYRTPAGRIAIADRLADLPEGWDYDGDDSWSGYAPDVALNFDDEGFDRDATGGYTGWRAFASYPFPGTYWPANGTHSEVLIRLPEAFHRDAAGAFNIEVYKVNLAILEAMIQRRDVPVTPVDEAALAVDLDRDGSHGTARHVAYDWAPREGRDMSWVGAAKAAQEAGEVHLAAGLYPEGTEFVQLLRYVGVTEDGEIVPAARIKEIRYARKTGWRTYARLEEISLDEAKDRDDFPDRMRVFEGDPERGQINPERGWRLQGFVEDANGYLRPQSFEETASCVGCHGELGVTTDSMFAFARKLPATAEQGGWYHWSQRGLDGLNEPKLGIANAGPFYEYSYYVMYNRSASEVRNDAESMTRFFDDEGALIQATIDDLHDDVTVALNPTRERALSLAKAYRTIVEDQDFVEGRIVNIVSLEDTVHQDVTDIPETGIEESTNTTGVLPCFDQGQPCRPNATQPELDARAMAVLGDGMGGPNGERYALDAHGIIDISRYAVSIEDVFLTFPPRLTLPTREIVPLSGMRGCYSCHRIATVSVEGDFRADIPAPLDAVGAAEGPGLTRLTDGGGKDLGARWSPDGSMVAFVSDRGGSQQIWLREMESGDLRQLTRGPATHGWPEWSPDSRHIAAWSHDPDSGRQAIASIDVTTGTATLLAESDDYLDRPDWRPDGKWLAYAARIDGNWDIFAVSADGATRHRLTAETQMETNPLWSPDGSMLAYKVAPDKQYNLTLQNFMTFEAGLDAPRIHAWDGPQSVQMSDWSPDGSAIAYTAEIVNDASGADRVTYAAMVSEVGVDGPAAVALATVPLAQGLTLGDRGAYFSPNGQHVAFWAWDTEHNATLWLHDRETGTVERVTEGGPDLYPQWRPDGGALIFESTRGGSSDLWLLDLDARG